MVTMMIPTIIQIEHHQLALLATLKAVWEWIHLIYYKMLCVSLQAKVCFTILLLSYKIANNISIQLAMQYCLLQLLKNSTQMRYRHSTCQFWESVLAIGDPKLLRFLSSDEHFGQINRGLSEKGKYKLISGSYNFTAPDQCLLRKSTTDVPNKVKCGIINLVSHYSVVINKMFCVLMEHKVGRVSEVDLRGWKDLTAHFHSWW